MPRVDRKVRSGLARSVEKLTAKELVSTWPCTRLARSRFRAVMHSVGDGGRLGGAPPGVWLPAESLRLGRAPLLSRLRVELLRFGRTPLPGRLRVEWVRRRQGSSLGKLLVEGNADQQHRSSTA